MAMMHHRGFPFYQTPMDLFRGPLAMSTIMKTDNHKILIMSAVTATVLLLAFQAASAFNPQPEPPAGEEKLTAPAVKPASVPKGVKARSDVAPRPALPGKPRAIDPGDDGMPAIKPRTMER